MPRKRSTAAMPPPPVQIDRTCPWPHGGRLVTAGTELSFHGRRGRYRFLEHCRTDKGEWLSVYGPVGAKSEGAMLRAFDPATLRTVHRVRSTDRGK